MRIFAVVAILLLCGGCETVSETVDQWFSQGPEGESSQAERVTDSTAWLIPSPYRELVVAAVAAVSGFVTARKKPKSLPKA